MVEKKITNLQNKIFHVLCVKKKKIITKNGGKKKIKNNNIEINLYGYNAGNLHIYGLFSSL